jgi:hypothetical protein
MERIAGDKQRDEVRRCAGNIIARTNHKDVPCRVGPDDDLAEPYLTGGLIPSTALH